MENCIFWGTSVIFEIYTTMNIDPKSIEFHVTLNWLTKGVTFNRIYDQYMQCF